MGEAPAAEASPLPSAEALRPQEAQDGQDAKSSQIAGHEPKVQSSHPLASASASALAPAPAVPVAGPLYKLEDQDPLAKPSYYGSKLPGILKHWPPATLSLAKPGGELVLAIKTPGKKDLIGMVKHFEVEAPLAKVIEVNEKFEEYPKIWEDVLAVKVQSRDRNRVVTEWIRKAPTFFLSKIRFRMSTVTDRSVPGRVVYRHQLIDGNMVHSSDSLVVFERAGDQRTRVTVLNFFDPEVGPLRAFAEGKISYLALFYSVGKFVKLRKDISYVFHRGTVVSSRMEAKTSRASCMTVYLST